MSYWQQAGATLYGNATLRAQRYGIDPYGLLTFICKEPQRQKRIPRDVYIEMLGWTPEQWQEWDRGCGHAALIERRSKSPVEEVKP